jgi:hypothetical protein
VGEEEEGALRITPAPIKRRKPSLVFILPFFYFVIRKLPAAQIASPLAQALWLGV